MFKNPVTSFTVDKASSLEGSMAGYLGPKVKFCGHIVSNKGITMDPDKLRALRDFKVPCNVTDTKSFLGLLATFG